MLDFGQMKVDKSVSVGNVRVQEGRYLRSRIL